MLFCSAVNIDVICLQPYIINTLYCTPSYIVSNLQNRFICVYSQLGKTPCFPRSITRNNQPLLLNIYIVCSSRTLLAIALIYISLLPIYGILSKYVTYILLYYFRNLRKNEKYIVYIMHRSTQKKRISKYPYC